MPKNAGMFDHFDSKSELTTHSPKRKENDEKAAKELANTVGGLYPMVLGAACGAIGSAAGVGPVGSFLGGAVGNATKDLVTGVVKSCIGNGLEMRTQLLDKVHEAIKKVPVVGETIAGLRPYADKIDRLTVNLLGQVNESELIPVVGEIIAAGSGEGGISKATVVSKLMSVLPKDYEGVIKGLVHNLGQTTGDDAPCFSAQELMDKLAKVLPADMAAEVKKYGSSVPDDGSSYVPHPSS